MDTHTPAPDYPQLPLQRWGGSLPFERRLSEVLPEPECDA